MILFFFQVFHNFDVKPFWFDSFYYLLLPLIFLNLFHCGHCGLYVWKYLIALFSIHVSLIWYCSNAQCSVLGSFAM
ncbi:hypothetical protein F5Y19DRAFT_443516 [Xylariaceae sp. FL1651]|nr:hypothetical protein F5Y19DRAFT_443516 [Xylariaceae sp. FL1651]